MSTQPIVFYLCRMLKFNPQQNFKYGNVTYPVVLNAIMKKRSISFSVHAPSCPDAVTQAFLRKQANESELKTIKANKRINNLHPMRSIHGYLHPLSKAVAARKLLDFRIPTGTKPATVCSATWFPVQQPFRLSVLRQAGNEHGKVPMLFQIPPRIAL